MRGEAAIAPQGRLAAVLAVLLSLQCATRAPATNPAADPRCATDSECASGKSCTRGACLVACDPRVADGHDPRCPSGYTCWEEFSHLPGNVCREGEFPFRPSYVQRVNALEAEYLRQHDAGPCEGVPLFIVDGARVLDYECMPGPGSSRDR
jgi:hypothetical protein